jgi:hypothetical protein
VVFSGLMCLCLHRTVRYGRERHHRAHIQTLHRAVAATQLQQAPPHISAVLSVLLSPRIQDPLCFYRLSARSSCWSSGPWQLSPLIGESGPPSTQPANTSHGLPLEPHNTEIETETLLITVHPGRLSILDILVAARPESGSVVSLPAVYRPAGRLSQKSEILLSRNHTETSRRRPAAIALPMYPDGRLPDF